MRTGGSAPWAYFDIFGTGDQHAAANAQIQGLTSGAQALSNYVNAGNNALTTNYSSALAPFQQNYGQAQTGTQGLLNALGLGGAAGTNSALQALQNTPGYQFALNQGTQNVLRNNAATGNLASGKTATDLSNYAQGTAQQTYNNYVNQLQPFLNASNSAASGIGNLYSGLGNALNQNYNTLGNAAYGTNVGIGNANASADLAGLTASGNILGFGAGLLGLGTNTVGGGALSGLASQLPSLGAGLLAFSDARVKDDIEPVGELYDGQPIYRYRYKGDKQLRLGLMAQDVEKRDPDSVVEFGGIKAVNYKRATDFAAKLAPFLKEAA